MRKNKMMRLSALLLVAVLLSLSVIGGTWAKYVTTSSALEETVTVAKWGVEITSTLDKGYEVKNNQNNKNIKNIVGVLEDLDINKLTPLNAFDILIQLKNYLKKD